MLQNVGYNILLPWQILRLRICVSWIRLPPFLISSRYEKCFSVLILYVCLHAVWNACNPGIIKPADKKKFLCTLLSSCNRNPRPICWYWPWIVVHPTHLVFIEFAIVFHYFLCGLLYLLSCLSWLSGVSFLTHFAWHFWLLNCVRIPLCTCHYL